MTQRKELFVNYEEFDKPQKVGMGDGHTVEACGRGDIHFTMTLENGKPRSVTMCNALYVPKLTCNLFSVRATVMKGNKMKFENGSCWIYDRNGILLGTGLLVDKLYYLQCTSVTQECSTVATGSEVNNKADLWHQRPGHLNESQLREMASQDLVRGVNIPKSARTSFCEKCVEGKMAKKPFKLVGEIQSMSKLRVHSDVCGPMPTESIGGSRYFVTFIDDYSRC
ncbi:MAG: GAG-pre-integrase domain-containing protein, partial [Acidobacteria bacterium]|nr:GAG-pre-integrase domain-containing protein [Acidobacteriota bacterium]